MVAWPQLGPEESWRNRPSVVNTLQGVVNAEIIEGASGGGGPQQGPPAFPLPIERPDPDRFRNVNGVFMKLPNSRRDSGALRP